MFAMIMMRFCLLQIVDERDKSDKLWELLTTLHENPPKEDHGKTVSRKEKYVTFVFLRLYILPSIIHSAITI